MAGWLAFAALLLRRRRPNGDKRLRIDGTSLFAANRIRLSQIKQCASGVHF
ncbi:MAG: hypothetical protein ACYCVB_08265 [Bacilli bacterium]